MMEQLGFTTDNNYQDPYYKMPAKPTRQDFHQMAQKIMDDIGAMVEKKHNECLCYDLLND
jgi:hypothetical protein